MASDSPFGAAAAVAGAAAADAARGAALDAQPARKTRAVIAAQRKAAVARGE